MADTLNTESLLRLIAENTGKRISLNLEDLDLYLAVARAALAAAAQGDELPPLPDVLFDGYAVYKEVMANDPNTPRPTPDNVANVLDAVVRIMRREYGAACRAGKKTADYRTAPWYLAACKMGNILFNLGQRNDLPAGWKEACREAVEEWDKTRSSIKAGEKADARDAAFLAWVKKYRLSWIQTWVREFPEIGRYNTGKEWDG